MDNEASAKSVSKSKGTRKRSHTARATIGKKETMPELDEEFEVVGSKTASSVIRPRSTASKTQRKQAPINRLKIR